MINTIDSRDESCIKIYHIYVGYIVYKPFSFNSEHANHNLSTYVLSLERNATIAF